MNESFLNLQCEQKHCQIRLPAGAERSSCTCCNTSALWLQVVVSRLHLWLHLNCIASAWHCPGLQEPKAEEAERGGIWLEHPARCLCDLSHPDKSWDHPGRGWPREVGNTPMLCRSAMISENKLGVGYCCPGLPFLPWRARECSLL